MTPTEASVASGLPTHVPSEVERADLELLCVGALAPLAGFQGADGLVTLIVPEDVADAAVSAGGLTLLDPEGARQATLLPTATFPAPAGGVGLVGDVEALPYDGSAPFRRLRLSPESVREVHGDDYLLVVVDRPLTSADVKDIAAKSAGRDVVLLVLYGLTRRVLPPTALVRATLASAEILGATTALSTAVVVTPVMSRELGRENDAGPRDQALVRRVVDNYAAADVLWPVGDGSLPDQVREAMGSAMPGAAHRGLVLFFTGLSGSGKSTVAREVGDLLLERLDREITSLDGDIVRRHLSEGLGFSMEDRDRNIRRMGWVAAEIARHGGVVVVSPIAPVDETRRQVREMVTRAGGSFVLVHVATPLAECERRDRKGLYARARAGEIADFTGISSPYEVPEDAEVRLDTTDISVAEAAAVVLDHLRRAGHLSRRASTP